MAGNRSRMFVLLMLIVSISTVMIHPAFGQQYSIKDIGTLGGNFSAAYGLNNLGQVVGMSQTATGAYRAYVWDAQNGMRDLGILPGYDFSLAGFISDTGDITGNLYLSSGGYHGFLYRNNNLIDLGTLPGYDNSEAASVSDNGIVYVHAGNSPYSGRSFTWNNGTKTLLNLLNLPGVTTAGITTSGNIIGLHQTMTGFWHGYLSNTITAEFTDIGVLPGFVYSYPHGGNKSDQIIGASYNDLGQIYSGHAFSWQNGQMSDLGTLGGSFSYALGLNDAGDIVGESFTQSNENHAFLYTSGAMFDLNGLIPANSGWNLSRADAINNTGSIVGSGIIHGVQHAYLLTPNPKTLKISQVDANVTSLQAATITWKSSHISNSTAEYGKTTSYGQSSSTINLVSNHSISLSGLSPATLYHYRVKSIDSSGQSAVSRDFTFVTSEPTTSGGDQIFHFMITRQFDGSYRVDCAWTYKKQGDGQFQSVLFDVDLVYAILGKSSQPTIPDRLPIRISPFFIPGDTIKFFIVFPASAGKSGSRVDLHLGITDNTGPLLDGFTPIDRHATLP